jgi:hypothetical protein
VRVIEYTIEMPDQPHESPQYRLITSLLDVEQFPALLLTQEYHTRWEVESTIDEVKTHLLGRKVPIRSLKPREVIQEIYGLLLGHWAVRSLMVQAAQQQGIKRALAVKLTLEGYVHAEIIKILNVTSGFISKWKQAFEAYGVDGILLGYQGSTGYLYKEQRMEVPIVATTKRLLAA